MRFDWGSLTTDESDLMIRMGITSLLDTTSAQQAREWLAKRDRTPTGFDPKLLTPPKPAAYKHDPQRYQTLIDRVRRDVATCAKCHRDCVPCLVLEVQRTMQADRAEVRVSFPLAWCYDCARKEVPA